MNAAAEDHDEVVEPLLLAAGCLEGTYTEHDEELARRVAGALVAVEYALQRLGVQRHSGGF